MQPGQEVSQVIQISDKLQQALALNSYDRLKYSLYVSIERSHRHQICLNYAIGKQLYFNQLSVPKLAYLARYLKLVGIEGIDELMVELAD